MRAWIFVLLLAQILLAQPPDPSPQPQPKTMIDFRDELKLSKQQVKDIVATLTRFQDEGTTDRLKMMAAEREASSLIQRHADLVEIKACLLQMADLRYDLRLLDLETSRKVESIMTPEQFAKWQAIQVRERQKNK